MTLQDYQLQIIIQALKTHYHKYNKENDPQLYQHLNEVEFLISEIEEALPKKSLVGKTFVISKKDEIVNSKEKTEALMKGTARPIANDPIDW